MKVYIRKSGDKMITSLLIIFSLVVISKIK